MAITLLTYIGDGSTTDYVVNFTGGYINQADVKVYVQGETDSAGNKAFRLFTWLDTGNIRLASAVPSGQILYIERKTNIDSLAVIFEDGQIIDEDRLNDAHQQLLNAIQEAKTGYFESGIVGGLNLNNARITQVGTPTSNKDAVTKEYVDAVIPNNTVLVNTATTKANEAAASASTATTKASEASSSATSAASSAAAAAASEANAANINASNLSQGILAIARIADGSIITAKYQNGSITTAKLANGAVGTGQIANNAITALKILNDTITQDKLANNSVGTAKIADNSVNASKLNVSGNGTAGQVLKTDGDGSFSWGTGSTLPIHIIATVTGIFFVRNTDGSLPTNITAANVWSLSDQSGGGTAPSGKNHIELPAGKVIFKIAGAGGGGGAVSTGSDGGDTTLLGCISKGGIYGQSASNNGIGRALAVGTIASGLNGIVKLSGGGEGGQCGGTDNDGLGGDGLSGNLLIVVKEMTAGDTESFTLGIGGTGSLVNSGDSSNPRASSGKNGFVEVEYIN
jgi:hypothetical protein